MKADGSGAGWYPFDDGATLGELGSESGRILQDEEHSHGGRITLEADGPTAPFAITCGLYGWMVHTRFFSDRKSAVESFAAMKVALAEILGLARKNHRGRRGDVARVVEAVEAFVERFP